MPFSRFLTAAFALTLPLALHAQMHRVDKPEKVTRAVGVYEWTGDLAKPTAARLVPVSLFISGHMEDAGSYLARPVPLALETGNVYAVEHAGKPEGTLDIKMARQLGRTADADADPTGSWYGYGPFAPPAQPKTAATPASKVTAQVEGSNDDDRPHFVPSRSEQGEDTASTKPGSARHTPAPVDDNDPERPTLRGRASSANDTDGKKKPKREKPAGYVTGPAGGLNNDPDRPTLRHGKAQSDDAPQLEGLPPNMQQAIAVSDPSRLDDHVFTRAWESSDERAAVLHSFEAVASSRVRDYLKANNLVPAPAGSAQAAATQPTSSHSDQESGPPRLVRTPGGVSTRTVPAAVPTTKPASSSAARTRSKTTTKSTSGAPLSLGNVQLAGFELSYGGLPTFVYTAQVTARPAQAQTASLTVYVTLVGQRLPSGEMQLALQSVTDSGHLNRTPWMRFVDVVDADGSHRASLLFELRAAQSRQFALYRLISATAEQTFLSASLL